VSPGSVQPPPQPSGQLDVDHDGAADAQDCAPKDPAIHPGASDLPDLSFVDSNCDGIDGTLGDAIFVSPNGADGGTGTKDSPKRQIQAAVDTVKAGVGRYVVVAAGTYQPFEAATGVSVYGGYRPGTWLRSSSQTTLISGSPEGILADGTTGVVLQSLSVKATSDVAHRSAYGIRVIDGSAITLQRVSVTAGSALAGAAPGGTGIRGSDGRSGASADPATCGLSRPATCGGRGGAGGSPQSSGGDGGAGAEPGYFAAQPGGGPHGGAGGKNGDPGQPGGTGGDGPNGEPGAGGLAGSAVVASASGASGGRGVSGVGGTGGGGGSGGGGGGGDCFFCVYGPDSNGGGGGGGGGTGAGPGGGGAGGAGSFGIYLYGSIAVVQSSSIAAGSGADGANGGKGASGGFGGGRGYGGAADLAEVGRGGRGGLGGYGGAGGGGGGGAGGPSIGIFKGPGSKVTVRDSKIDTGAPGSGGQGGPGGGGLLGGPNGPAGENGKPGIAADVYPS
jgi:hypothetical protein